MNIYGIVTQSFVIMLSHCSSHGMHSRRRGSCVADVVFEIGEFAKKTEKKLFEAVCASNLSEISKILDRNFELVESTDSKGNSYLHIAIIHSSVEVIELLLARGAKISQVDCLGRTPLKIADEFKKPEVKGVIEKHLMRFSWPWR